MLKYKVRLTENDFKANNIVWREKYVAPDLSFISGVTDSVYHLERYSTISVVSPLTNNNSILNVETEVVTRLGYVIAKGKEYPISSFNGKNYVEINGRFFYENGGKYTIKNWQCETYKYLNGKYVPNIVEKTVEVSKSGNVIKLDTIYWIENGFVNIDGYQYIFDKNEQQPNGTRGCIKFTDNGKSIEDVTKCDSMYYMPYDDATLIHDVCKFKGYITPHIQYDTRNIKFAERFFYTKYKDYYCPVVQTSLNEGSTFVCQVPYNGNVSDVRNYTVSASTDDGAEVFIPTVGNYDISDINDLVRFKCFTKIDDFEYSIVDDYRESPSSRLIMIMLEDQGSTIDIGEELTFVSPLDDGDINYLVLESDNSVLYDGNKYYAEANLFDKAVIDGTEYDVTYDKLNSEIAYVEIEGEQVPMKLNDDTLTRYGYVVNSSSVATSESYSIRHYSGVTVEGKSYIIRENGAELTIPNKIKFVVDDIKGNSLLICKASISPNEYSNPYDKEIELANEVVNNQSNYSLQVNNMVLGSKPISKESVFSSVDDPISSDDAYNIFDDLQIESNNGYVNIPINLASPNGIDLLKSETIKKDFCEKEREKAINRIVDLEKDVYSPKIMESPSYSGSYTDFRDVYAININLHFRTRNLDNWKVNEVYNDVTLSATSNWFITDYEPYKSMINSISGDTTPLTREQKYNKLMEHSDLLYFLNFDNNDVFYQKSRISKSFLRFTFYDSYDPQTQSLLATSSVFMNEHDLYKKYIDNSRKGIDTYLNVGETLEECVISPKIRVSSERLATTRERRDECVVSGTDFVEISGGSYCESGCCVSLKEDGKRLDSRFVINNKYVTDTSSEGFYIYMFREYAEKLHPKPIYMKVEFNHAGIGKTIPFVVPMKWSGETDSDEVYPQRKLTLSANTVGTIPSDLDELKNGVPLSWVYAQSYIPLYAVYDFKNKEYGYIFDERYVNIDDDGTVTLNLFEIKIMEDNDPDSNFATAVINDIFSNENNT